MKKNTYISFLFALRKITNTLPLPASNPSSSGGMGLLTYLFLFMATIVFSSCEDVINPSLEPAEPIVVVDAWLSNKPGPQTIKITRTQPYFQNALPPGLSGAVVRVVDNSGTVYNFTETTNGNYVWTPTGNEVLSQVGFEYKLSVTWGGETYEARSSVGRVPPIDSLTFFKQPGNAFVQDLYLAQFWAVEPKGRNDIYWIKAFKNGQFLNKPSEINLAYDAGFSRNPETTKDDSVAFIFPIRTNINPFDQDKNGRTLSPYSIGDSVYVEINSITLEAFNFLSEVVIQTNRPGGFGELFATPLANVSTNIKNVNPKGSKAVGFFNVSATTGMGRRLKSLSEVKEE